MQERFSRVIARGEMVQNELSRVCAVDIETTGLCAPSNDSDRHDEIIQLAIVASDGSEAFDELFCPTFIKDWSAAEQCHGISSIDVQNKPLFAEKLPIIQSIVDQFDLLVFYNAEFDLAFLMHQGVGLIGKQYFCLMRAFSRLRSRNSHNQYLRRYSLEQCARYFNIRHEGISHNALTDARTTMSCYLEMLKQLGHTMEMETVNGK
jgi:DNA polymerase III epsilon subunit-like protein